MDTEIKNLQNLRYFKTDSKEEEILDLCSNCHLLEYVNKEGICVYCRYREEGNRQNENG